LIKRFHADRTLGMASGKTFLVCGNTRKIEWCPDDHVRGPAKMYSRNCYTDIGGLQPVRGWDTIDEVSARIRGYHTRSFIDLELVHHRPIDGRQTNVLRSRYDMGKTCHYLGYDARHMLFRSARSAVQDYPRLVGGVLLFCGYLTAVAQRQQKCDPQLVVALKKEQRRRFTLRHFRTFLRQSLRGS
jgi:biofilm PGA synthesis N-glycosyltransferase PgaC